MKHICITLPTHLLFFSAASIHCCCFSTCRCSRLTILRSVFNYSCFNFKARCDFVPILVFHTCFHTACCTRLGLLPNFFTSNIPVRNNFKKAKPYISYSFVQNSYQNCFIISPIFYHIHVYFSTKIYN